MITMPDRKWFCFDYSADADPERAQAGWGNGILYVNNKPFWFFDTVDDPAPVSWTWVDFLEHVTAIWRNLVIEQGYPFSWLDDFNMPLANIWEIAEERWSRLGEAAADAESDVLGQFVDRHNLSAGWVGMSLPALLWLRSGESVWLYPEGAPVIRASFTDCLIVLRDICDKIAESCKDSSHQRVATAVASWKSLRYIDPAEYISLQGRCVSDMLSVVQGDDSASGFWEIPAQIDLREAANDSQLLAAARMTAPVVEDPAVIRTILQLIKSAPKASCRQLDAISAEAHDFLSRRPLAYPYAYGYALAEWVRDSWLKTSQNRFDIEGLIADLSIGVEAVNFETSAIEAIAIWGSHGPHIFLNTEHSYHQNTRRRRMTLAHELCHLLIDRKGALPAVDVLGGAVDHFIEQRANAFAAELLLPRVSVVTLWSSGKPLFNDLIKRLMSEFDISKSVACAQIFNSNIYDQLSAEERKVVSSRMNLINHSSVGIESWIV